MHRLEPGQCRIERVLLDEPRGACVVSRKPSVMSAATTAGVIASNICPV